MDRVRTMLTPADTVMDRMGTMLTPADDTSEEELA